MIDAGICTLRPWQEHDIEPLVPIANDAEVVRYLRDRFPHPYTIEDARAWIALNQKAVPEHFAIEFQGGVVGGVSVERMHEERRLTAIVGYWIGTAFSGRGIATAAASALSEHAFATTDIRRLESIVYHPNVASMKVLEKCGYVREGIMRQAVIKGERIYDAHLYAKVRS